MIRPLSLSVLTLLSLAAGAHAQSSSSSIGRNDYSISLNGASTGSLSDLSIEEDLYTYNLVLPFSFDRNDPYYAPYTSTTGSATAYAEVDPSTGYDASSLRGFAGVASGADAGPTTGRGVASVGTELDLTVTNNGADDVILDASILASVSGFAGTTGPHVPNVNYAQVDTYAGFVTYNLADAGNTYSLQYLNFTGNDAGTTTNVIGDWNYLSGATYSLGATVTIKSGESWRMGFYASSRDFAAVPEPASLAALGLGAAALIRRRKKA